MTNTSLAEKEKSGSRQKVWNDPVWSKVIASIIFSCIGFALAYFGADRLLDSSQNPEIEIRSHGNNSRIDREISLDGNFSNISDKDKMIAFVYTPVEGRYYWRDVSVYKGTKTWKVSNLIVGSDASKGEKFEIGVALVEKGVVNEDNTKNIPNGVNVLKQITVVRN